MRSILLFANSMRVGPHTVGSIVSCCVVVDLLLLCV